MPLKFTSYEINAKTNPTINYKNNYHLGMPTQNGNTSSQSRNTSSQDRNVASQDRNVASQDRNVTSQGRNVGFKGCNSVLSLTIKLTDNNIKYHYSTSKQSL